MPEPAFQHVLCQTYPVVGKRTGGADQINNIMTNHQNWRDMGLGESGETYMVGSDLTLKNESRFLIEDPSGYLAQMKNLGMEQNLLRQIEKSGSVIGRQKVDSTASQIALKGKTHP